MTINLSQQPVPWQLDRITSLRGIWLRFAKLHVLLCPLFVLATPNEHACEMLQLARKSYIENRKLIGFVS